MDNSNADCSNFAQKHVRSVAYTNHYISLTLAHRALPPSPPIPHFFIFTLQLKEILRSCHRKKKLVCMFPLLENRNSSVSTLRRCASCIKNYGYDLGPKPRPMLCWSGKRGEGEADLENANGLEGELLGLGGVAGQNGNETLVNLVAEPRVSFSQLLQHVARGFLRPLRARFGHAFRHCANSYGHKTQNEQLLA